MAWVELTKERVTPRLSPAESNELFNWDRENHASGQDLLGEVINSVVAEIRAAIAQCEKNTLDPRPGHIPESCINDALSMVSYYVGTRVGIPIDISRDPRYNAWAKARENLDKMRTCEITVEDPSTGVVAASGSNASSVVISTPTRMDRGHWNF